MAKQTAALHPTTLLLDASPLRHQRSVLIRRSCSAAILPRYSPGLHGVHPWRRRCTTSVEALESFQAYGAPGQQHPRHRVEQCHKCTMACHPQFSPPYGTHPRAGYRRSTCREMAPGSQKVLGTNTSAKRRIRRDIERIQYDTEGAFVAPTWSLIEARDSTNGAHHKHHRLPQVSVHIFTAVELGARPSLKRTTQTVHRTGPNTLLSGTVLRIYQRRPRPGPARFMMLRHSASSTKENLTNAAALGAVTRRTARPRATFTNDSQLASHSWPAWEFGTETGSLRLSRVGERERAWASQVLTIPSLGSGQPSRGNPRKKKSMYFLKYTGRASVYIHGTVLCLQKSMHHLPGKVIDFQGSFSTGVAVVLCMQVQPQVPFKAGISTPLPFPFFTATPSLASTSPPPPHDLVPVPGLAHPPVLKTGQRRTLDFLDDATKTPLPGQSQCHFAVVMQTGSRGTVGTGGEVSLPHPGYNGLLVRHALL